MKVKHYIAHSAMEENGKIIPVQSYENHVKGVYGGANRNLERIKKYTYSPWFPVIKKSVLLAAIYHDLGKLDKQPQNVLHGLNSSKMLNHVDAGVAYLLSRYNKDQDITFLIAAYLVLAHHVGLPNYYFVFKTERKLLDFIISPKDSFRDKKPLSKYNMGKRKMVKTHTNENLNKYIRIHKKICKIAEPLESVSKRNALSFINNPMALKVAISILVDSDHEDTSLNYGEPHPFRQKRLDAKNNLKNLLEYVNKLQEKYKSGLLVSSQERLKLRQDFFNACGRTTILKDDNFFLIDGTVGIGKTLSLMYLSLKIAIENDLDTLMFVLPYIALIDQSAEEYVNSIFDDDKNIEYEFNIIHSIWKSKNIFQRKYQKGFNAPINITTNVNFFKTISNNHTSVFKNIHKFVGSVIALDEYHAMGYEFWPAALLIMNDMAKYFSCKFIFSSGTPPKYWNIREIADVVDQDINVKEVIPEELYAKMIDMEKRRIKIQNSIKEEWSFERLASEILKIEKSTFVILGTRLKTVAFTKFIKDRTNRKIFIRYSGLAPRERKKQLFDIKNCLLNREPVIVIATQGSDIGLNISFFCGFKEVSDFDSMSQLLGRINRNCEYSDSFMHIFKLSKEPNEAGVKYYDNPSFAYRRKIFEGNEDLHNNISPEYCTAVAEEEIADAVANKRIDMELLARLWRDKKFEEFGDSFNLIKMPMMVLLVNEDIFNRMKRKEFVSYSEIQDNVVNIIYNEKNIELIKNNIVEINEEILNSEDDDENNDDVKDKFNGLYYWRGIYDPDTYGIYADPVFGILEMPSLIV